MHLVVKNRTMHPHAMVRRGRACSASPALMIGSPVQHLHGHTFQVVSIGGQAIDGPLRDTVVVPAGCVEVVLAFQADNPGVWAVRARCTRYGPVANPSMVAYQFHCHMEMHMAAGSKCCGRTGIHSLGDLLTAVPTVVTTIEYREPERRAS